MNVLNIIFNTGSFFEGRVAGETSKIVWQALTWLSNALDTILL